MTEETLETILLGRIAKELKDEIAIGRQVKLAKTIAQALRIHDVVRPSEQYHCELHDFVRKDKPCDKQCDGCKVIKLD